jgi:antitoxin component YwqK of YwqJK toxin-antitoxin module
MAENKEQKSSLNMVQKTSILGTDKEGNTTYKLSFYIDDVPVKSKAGGLEVYAIEVLNKDGVLKRYEMLGDIPDGTVTEYYENGETMMVKSYFNGQKTGMYKLF